MLNDTVTIDSKCCHPVVIALTTRAAAQLFLLCNKGVLRCFNHSRLQAEAAYNQLDELHSRLLICLPLVPCSLFVLDCANSQSVNL